MEVITEVTPLHYGILLVLGIISEIIVGGIIFKKIQKYKKFQAAKKHHLLELVSKFENAILRIQRHVDDYYTVAANYKDLEIRGISGIISHQLGHISRFRGLLK